MVVDAEFGTGQVPLSHGTDLAVGQNGHGAAAVGNGRIHRQQVPAEFHGAIGVQAAFSQGRRAAAHVTADLRGGAGPGDETQEHGASLPIGIQSVVVRDGAGGGGIVPAVQAVQTPGAAEVPQGGQLFGAVPVDEEEHIVHVAQVDGVLLLGAEHVGQDHKGALWMGGSQLPQGLHVHAPVQEKVNIDPKLCALLHQALTVRQAHGSVSGAEGQGPGNVEAAGLFQLPDPLGAPGAALQADVQAQGLDGIGIHGLQYRLDRFKIGALLIGQKVPDRLQHGVEQPSAGGEVKAQVHQVPQAPLGVPLDVPHGPVYGGLAQHTPQIKIVVQHV